MRKLTSLLLVLAMASPTMAMAASNKENYIGFGMGVASQNDVSTTGYTILFQMQQARNAALGFAYQDSDKLTFTYKGYTGQYGNSIFYEGGILLNTANDAVAPVIGIGSDLPLQGDIRLSATAGVGFDAGGAAFIGRLAFLFEM
jgi:hypothetical protein